MGPVNIFEFEDAARARMPKGEYDRIAGGATDEITLRRTRVVLDSLLLRPRRLVDIAQRDLSTTVLGHRIAFPVLLAPSGGHGRVHPEGELATARAAGAMGTVMVLSESSTYPMEEVAKAATGPLWFQVLLYRDRGLARAMAQRAEAAGFSALTIALDTIGMAKRERDIRNNLRGAASWSNYAQNRKVLGSKAPQSVVEMIDLSATWSYLDWLAANTSLPLVAKAIMTAEDARLCVEHGVKALIVSNHGARNLDTTFTTIEVLPEVVEAVDGRLEVYMDGGIRRGTDVLKALALGARAVLIGRPALWGLAADGEAGVRAVLQMLRDELDLAMAMCGCPTIKDINRSLLGTASPFSGVLPRLQDFRLPSA